MKVLSGFLFCVLLASPLLAATKAPQRKIREFRTLKVKNTARFGRSRQLADNLFKKNPLIFGVEKPEQTSTTQTYQFLQMAVDMERFKHNVKELSRLIGSYQERFITFRENFEERINSLNDEVNHELLGLGSI